MAAAKTSIQLVVQGVNLSAGQNHNWKWNNALKGAVTSFQVHPLNSQNNSHLLYRAQVRNVRSLLRNGKELEIYFQVHNWGTVWTNYHLYMAVTRYA